MSTSRVILIVLGTAGAAAAAPAVDPVPVPAPLVLQTSLFDTPTPPPPVPSLRLEAARVVAERFQENWRYPEPGAIAGFDGGGWYFGVGHYRPRTRRSAALHAGSIGATLLGEILLSADSPLAGIGAMVTGATLDAAGADADRDAEAQRKH